MLHALARELGLDSTYIHVALIAIGDRLAGVRHKVPQSEWTYRGGGLRLRDGLLDDKASSEHPERRQPSRLGVDAQLPQGLGRANALNVRFRSRDEVIEKGTKGFGRAVRFRVRDHHDAARR